MSKNLQTILKVSVTALGLGYVLWKVPLAEIVVVFSGVDWAWVLIAFVLVVVSLVIRAYRWKLLLQGLNVRIPFGRLVELYFAGNFFNAFLPSGFGGDALRMVEAARDVPGNVAAGTVIVDRLTGLLMLFVMALLALPFRPAGFPQELAIVVAAFSISGLLGGVILLDGRLIRRFGAWLPAKLSPVGDGPVAKLLQAVQGCGRKAILGALAVSTLFNLILVAWWAAAGRALGFHIPYSHYLLVVPIMSVALLVPSVGGLGVREYLSPILFASAGLVGAEAVGLSLLVFAIMRAASLVGAPVYILATVRENRKRSASPSTSETTIV